MNHVQQLREIKRWSYFDGPFMQWELLETLLTFQFIMPSIHWFPPPPKKRLRCPYARHDTNFHSLLIRRNSVVNRKWKRCYGFTADPFRDRSTPSLETNASLSSQRGSRRRREATLGNVFPGPDWTAGRRALDTRTAAACRWRKRENELKSHGRPRENPPIRADEGAAPLLMSH